jgi:hypothetical protein
MINLFFFNIHLIGMLKLVQDSNKCSKEKCNKELNKVINDNNLKLEKKKLFKTKDLKKKEKIIANINSNKNLNEFDLCVYKNCKIHKKLQEYKIKLMKDKINLYKIKFPKEYQIKYDLLIQLTSKPSLTDEEYIKMLFLFQILSRFISNKQMEFNKDLLKSYGDYINCGLKECKVLQQEVLSDKDLTKKKLSAFFIKDDNKRNKEIREVFSNEKQVKLDKCITNKCNKASLKTIQAALKDYYNKIKYFNIKIPDNIKLPDIKKITEDNIPEYIIKLNQIASYIQKNEYIVNI